MKAALLCMLLVLSALPVAASAPLAASEPSDVVAAIKAVSARSAGLKAYTFDADLHLKLHTFPWVSLSLAGSGQYERNGDYTLDFKHLPSVGHGYEHVSLAYLDPRTWSQQYTMTIASRNGDTVVLDLHDRKQTPLKEAHATLDRYGVREIVWKYNYGGVIRLTVDREDRAGYQVPVSEDADIVMPRYHATAHANFTNYHIVADDR